MLACSVIATMVNGDGCRCAATGSRQTHSTIYCGIWLSQANDNLLFSRELELNFTIDAIAALKYSNTTVSFVGSMCLLDLRSCQSTRRTMQTAATPVYCSPEFKKIPQSTSPQKAPRINDSTLHPQIGALRCRLDHYGKFHAPQTTDSKSPCALHRYLRGRESGSLGQTRGKIVCCSICRVNLCIKCHTIFHQVQDIVGAKEELVNSL